MALWSFIIQETLGDPFKSGITPLQEEELLLWNMEEEEDLEIITIGDLIIIIIIRTKDSINPDLSDSDLGEVEEDSDLGEEDIKFNY